MNSRASKLYCSTTSSRSSTVAICRDHLHRWHVLLPPQQPSLLLGCFYYDGSHARRSAGLLPLTLVYASTHFPNMATPPLWLRSRSVCPDDKGLRHREACLPDGTHSVRGGL